ncbi:hypothetical protein IFM51744_01126 [Aspergillus udagawae]|nr:hypothetical protein IFM51744_01126 [Aspergillus udagawae]
MSPQFSGAPAETMAHRTEMQSTMLSLPGSPTAMGCLPPVSHQHAETALQGEQEQGSHFDNAFFDPDDISFEKLHTHVPDDFDWEAFDKTYRNPREQGANVLFERRNLIHTHNARGYGDIQRLADDHGHETQYAGIFERAVETRNKGQLDADIWGSIIQSPIPPSINSVLEESPIKHHNNTPRAHRIEQGTARHGVGSSNAQDHEEKDDIPSYGDPSVQQHDVSVESIGVGSSNVGTHEDTDHACSGGTSGAYNDVEMTESHTCEGLDAGTSVVQACVQAVEEPAKKTTPPLAKQSDGGRRRNGNQGQTYARNEPIHSDVSGEKDETSEAQSSSQKNSGDSTPPEANLEDLIDPALTASIQNLVPNSETANMATRPAHNAEKAYGTPAGSQETQLAYPSGSQGVTTSSMQDESQQSNGSAVLDHHTNNQAHRPPAVQHSQRRSLSSAAAPNHVDKSQEHPARDISNEQQQIQPRPVNSARPAQGQAPQSPHASVISAAASNDHHSSEAHQALSEQASSDSAADRRKKPTVVDKLFPQINTIPGLPTSHDLMNPEWNRPEIQTTEIQTRFASLEEAMSALDSPKGPGRDPHLVVSQAQKVAIVNSFLRAMMNLKDVDDKAKTTLVWKNTIRRKPVEIEVACWNILEAMIEYHRTMPLPPPKEKKRDNKGRKENEEDEEDEEEKKKVKDPARTGALLSFPDRAAAIVRIFHVSKSTCKRMLDYGAKYIREFVDAPLDCLVRCRANVIVNQTKGGHIKTGRAVAAKKDAAAKAKAEGKGKGKGRGKGKAKAEAEAEAELPVGGDSADEAHEVEEAEEAEKAGNDSQETVTVQGQDIPGQRGPSYASAARRQSSYAHRGQYSQGYSMQGQTSTEHNQGMNNNRHVQGIVYTGQYQGASNTGHIQRMTYPGQSHGVCYTGYNNIFPGVSNSGQIQRTINAGQLPPTNTGGLRPSMNNIVNMFPMDQALTAPRLPYGSHSGYDQLSISPELSAAAAPNSHAPNSHTSSMDSYLWEASLGMEMPPAPQHPLQLPTYHQPTSTSSSVAGLNPVVSRSIGSNHGLPLNNQTRGRKRGSTETGTDEHCPPTKRRR